MPKLHHKELLDLSELLLVTGGISPEDARLVAKLLVRAELRGYPGHGVTRVAQYLNFIKRGTINLSEKPKILREGKTTAVIDGNHYIGQVAAHEGMQLAINKAQEHGAGIVTIRRAGHSGRLADYMEMAAEAGMIGVGLVSVGSGTTTLYGGMERIAGTNPMAFGIPVRNGQHIVMDFATASMSMGEIQKRVAKKEKLPDGVMLDGHGNPTNDFKAFRGPPRGVFLPFGGHKGSAVALVTEILGGILSGNGPSKDWWNKGGHGVNGVFLQALAVDEFQPLNQFLDKIDEFIAFVKSTKPAPGFREILLPGEHARANEARQLQDGVEIDDETWMELKELAIELHVSLPTPV
ncbi:MAG TPA: Ldh family oxidoreductase [Candidatus Acidoferrales bacterium]|nr:Ldh family oxidoreductase [Candidatus Acidoferrales bacterium]